MNQETSVTMKGRYHYRLRPEYQKSSRYIDSITPLFDLDVPKEMADQFEEVGVSTNNKRDGMINETSRT